MKLVIGLGILCFIGYGATFSAIGLFFDSLRLEYHLSSAGASMLVSAFLVAMSISSLLAGRLLDLFGARRVMLGGIILAFAGLLYSARATGIAHLVAGFIIAGIGAGGSTYVPCMFVVAKNIHRGTGIATGIIMSAASAGSAVCPVLIAYLIGALGWRDAMTCAGLIVLVAGLPAVLLTIPVSRSSEAMVVPEGRPAGTPDKNKTLVDHWSYLRLCLMQIFYFIGFMGMYFHFIPFMTEQGYALNAASSVYAVVNLICALGMLAIGWLADRFGSATILAVCLVLNAASMLLPDFMRPPHFVAVLVSFTVAWGLTQGAASQLSPMLVAKIVPASSYGVYCGMMSLLQGLAIAVGPVLIGAMHDHTGDYLSSFHLGALLVFLSALALLPQLVGPTRLPVNG